MTEPKPKRAAMTGYKATDADIKCRGYQFTPGEWHEVVGDIEMCASGFHFCEQPSGPWNYYSSPGTRLWKVEAEDVLESEWEPGTGRKHVARRIRLTEEIIPDGNENTGNENTGNWNTGNWNTGNWNTGNWNTGNWNTGNWNTGDRNTGDRNTGDRNTGDGNTGNWNTGDRNTGDGNTGNWNTGNWNTGNWNTGNGNATDRSAGFFCSAPQFVPCFDGDTGLTFDQFEKEHGSLSNDLAYWLGQDKPIEFEPYKGLPNITPEKLEALHAKHKAARATLQTEAK